jgi:hypothetical protein
MLLVWPGAYCATRVSGRVTDQRIEPLPGVNIFVAGTYDGCTSGPDGSFSFETSALPVFTLKATFVGYESWSGVVLPGEGIDLAIVLHECMNTLDAVTITAGVFAAADRKRASVMEPLDIYTTASANGDVVGAMRTMPGAQAAIDDGRLLVRGGDAGETKTYIDGLLAAKPYYSKTPDVATRGRFAPSLFSGVMFNTGGYSAEYGQALSSVLVLNSTDMAESNNTGVSLMSIGGELNQTWAFDRQSLMLSGSYTNLWLSNKITKPLIDWKQPMQAYNLSAVYRYKPSSRSLLKAYTSFDQGQMAYRTKGEEEFRVSSSGKTSYTNLHYQQHLSENSLLKVGISATYDQQELLPNAIRLENKDFNLESRAAFSHILSPKTIVAWGISDTYTRSAMKIGQGTASEHISIEFEDHTLAAFIEPEFRLSKKLALRPGVRAEYSTALNKYSFSPRFALAVKTGEYSQLSAAWGHFCQNPDNSYLRLNADLDFEKAEHYIAGYQWGNVRNRLFRAELYHKTYSDLILWEGQNPFRPVNTRNGGKGHASGIDLFWRDRKSIRGFDYWLTYSYIATERQYQIYPKKARPHFAANHTFSTVAKYWLNFISTQVGASYSLASGRPYDDPNTPEFMDGSTLPYSNLSLNLSHVFYIGSQYSVLYCSISNVFGNENIVGYRSSYEPGANGQFALYPLRDDVKRFFLVALLLNF